MSHEFEGGGGGGGGCGGGGVLVGQKKLVAAKKTSLELKKSTEAECKNSRNQSTRTKIRGARTPQPGVKETGSAMEGTVVVPQRLGFDWWGAPARKRGLYGEGI